MLNSYLFITIFLILLLAWFGAPLFSLILSVSIIGFTYQEIDLTVIPIELYRLTNTPLLLALPLFTFTGYLMSESNTSQRLVRLSSALLGWIPSELVLVTLFTSALFTAFTGATGVTIVALGALLYPALKQSGYSEKFSLGLITTSGSLGLLLPPSLPLILYVVIVQQLDLDQTISIEQVFLAGIFPTLLMILVLFLWSIWQTRHSPLETKKYSNKELISALRESIWEIPLPFIVLGGIFSGFFAVSEAAAVTALYIIIVEVFIYKEVSLSQLPKVIENSMTMIGGILLILASALAMTNYFVDAEVPFLLFEWLQSHVTSPITFLLLLNIFLLLLGAILDIFSAIVIMSPLIVPIAINFGVHPVHLGIIFLANMQLGYLTPPVGMNLFIASYRFKKPIFDIYHSTIVMMLLILGCVLLITYIPAISLFFVT
ncbi:MAG: TRAP transporter large permease subunit [gamma proteobacterium symbiont of Bathyaustriella thionipta]|nr:TRAP transporter large permease subunit [gamma proteobacterium symbiont of Bathyaustriella thionipta]MCU7949228.1 TRAP transporter large permease subunit [gamma proteobacterium symbiont of Bathyaustriella thionipta]MCU7954812.1 TRAP transporter large permease subunit [gamma proteobacterium symbiont of Bathyaustriella thionipta]MCU7955830.1 TRAP transporter large permease subunit [gamma proteobacterium symbiont of Bathyaustriella thionipta]MCU7967259.1 TRAP transporter large permease subunit 